MRTTIWSCDWCNIITDKPLDGIIITEFPNNMWVLGTDEICKKCTQQVLTLKKTIAGESN